MAANKPQFDMLLGGTQSLPVEFSVGRFASARAQEIAALTQAIEDPQRTGLVFQKLPKHMRRRVMSRTSKRMPRRLREAHMHQLRKSGLPLEPKRPSRKFRRRPGNLLLEYNRRQKKYVWLETHLWHAKRFHMIEKWGYKLADFPNDKSFRACYRAMANHCLLQDISYYCCIELSGPVDELLRHLHKLTNEECGLTFGAKAFLDGTREGSVMLFHQNTFPYGAIGVVSFLWKPSEEIKSNDEVEISETRTLWMWVHPAFYQELLDELILLFHFSAVKNEADADLNKVPCRESFAEIASNSDSKISEETMSLPVKKKCKLTTKVNEKKKKLDVEKTKLETRNVPFIRTPKYCSDNGSVEMVLLKDTLNRFRLTGPLSQAVLLESLRIANILEGETRKKNPDTKEEESSFADTVCLQSSDVSTDDCTIGENMDWWMQFYGVSHYRKESWHYQASLWQSLKGAASPAQLPPHLVFALTILDPRLQLPSKRTKAVPDEKGLTKHHNPEDLNPQQYHCENIMSGKFIYSVSKDAIKDLVSNAMWGQESEEQITSSSSLASVSPIWSSHVRDLATNFKMSSAELADIRSRNLVPGFMLEEFEHDASQAKSYVPILLIQQPGSRNPAQKRLGFSSGWDVVMPAGWALPLWLALVFRGARAGGLRESRSLGFEMGSESVLPPDTVSGSTEAEAQRMQLTEHYFRLPPDKRPNYVKLGIRSPFICSWDFLVNDWSQRTPESLITLSKTENEPSSCNIRFFVLRERKKLECLKAVISSLNVKQIKKNSQNACNFPELAVLFSGCTDGCLVPVTIHMCGRGSPADSAIICLPSETDVDNMARNATDSGPTEPLHTDQHQTERKELRTEHKKLLKRLRRKRVREKQKLEERSAAKQDASEDDKHVVVATKRKANEPPPTKDITDKHVETLRALWLPQTQTVKESCSRTVIGFITKGNFSFTESKGAGQGYVVISALLQLVALYESKLREGNKLSAPWVLVRNPTSLQYRFGVLNIASAM